MNFLSHYYNELPCDDPYFTAGVILPDLLYNYGKRNGVVVKLHPKKLVDNGTAESISLRTGVSHHYIADNLFHSSDFFERETTEIERRIRQHDFLCFPRRLFAFSHIFLELMLDRKILMQNPDTCDSLYALLDVVDLKKFAAFMALHTTQIHANGTAKHFDQFRRIRFIYDYVIDDRLIGLLGHINMNIGNPAMKEADKQALQTVIRDYEKTLFPQKFIKFQADL